MYTKKIILIFFILSVFHTLYSNPFRSTSSGTGSIPVVRTSGSPSPVKLVEIQMKFRSKMAELIVEIKENKSPEALMFLLFIGFLYGVVHAAGPGHRKTVLFSIFLSNKSKWWEPGLAGSLSAFLHGFSGIALILIFKEFSTRFLSNRVDLVSTYMETGSFLLLLLIAILLFILKMLSILRSKNKDDIKEVKEHKSFYYTVLLTSMFPCPGAILILILALSLNVLNIGILTVIFLSIGMGFTISITAYLGRGGRVGLFKILKTRESKIEKISNYLELIGYLFLFLFSLWMVLPLII